MAFFIASEISEGRRFCQLYPVGNCISKCYVTSVDEDRKRADLPLPPNLKEALVYEL